MASRNEFLGHLWRKVINSFMDESWIDKQLRMSERFPNAPFADLGPLLARLLELGATRRELSLFARAIAYRSVFQTLYAFRYPGIDEKGSGSLHESILNADPSGRDGRPNSAPAKEQHPSD
jgi:hypothetical protein